MGALRIMLVAGEPSGDLLGAPLMRALRAAEPDVAFSGIGGPQMAGEGLSSLVPFEDLAVMGLAEVLPRAATLLGHIRRAAAFARETRPDLVVTIDSPGFSFRLARRLQGAGIPLVHYVAPSVWAWRPGRARKIAPLFDHLLTLLPFEPPWFEREGLASTFVGHPAVERAEAGDGAGFRARHGIARDAAVLVVLPGSRRSETMRLLPVFGEAVRRLKAARPGLRIVVPTVATVEQGVRDALQAWPADTVLVASEAEKGDAFAAADAALAASGTVALELALARVPMAIAYRANWLTALIVRRLVTTPYGCLVNVLLGRRAVPELIQEACTPERCVAEVARLLDDAQARDEQVAASVAATASLASDAGPPSEIAARVVLDVARKAPTK